MANYRLNKMSLNLNKLYSVFKILVVILLVILIFYPSETYLELVRYLVTGVVFWGVYLYLKKDAEEDENQQIIILFFYIVLFFLYNPIYNVTFQDYQWIPIHSICSVLLILSIVLHESTFIIINFLRRRSISTLLIFSLFFAFLGLYLTTIEFIEPFNLNYLKKSGNVVTGRITKISPNIEFSKDIEGEVDDAFVVSFQLEYKFNLQNEQEYIGQTNDGENPISDVRDDKFIDIHGIDYIPKDSKIYPIKIYYEKNNPFNNRSAFDVEKTLSSTLINALFPYIFLTGFIFIWGIWTFRKNYKK